MWQGYLDSNQGMAASKAAALPLGDSPTKFEFPVKENGAEGET